MSLLFSTCMVLGCVTAGLNDAEVWESVCGPADVSRVSGNGGLTVGVNPHGRITSCRWPSPGYSGQLSYRTSGVDSPALGAAPWHGAMWAIRSSDHLFWLTGTRAQGVEQRYAGNAVPVIETRGMAGEGGPAFTQTLFVHPTLDVLAVRIEVESPEPPKLYWFQNFSPCTRRLPELPLGDWLLDSLNDFAVFAAPGGNTICHFRPKDPGADDWAKARDLAAQAAAPAAWEVFNEGVWIATASPNPVRGFQCGVDGEADSAWAGIESGHLAGRRAAVGACQSALDIEPAAVDGQPGTYAATVWLAFGANRPAVEGLLAQAREKGFDTLRRETEAYWNTWFKATDVSAAAREALLTIALATDRSTGAVVRAPISQPPLALVSAQDAAWITVALDEAGHHDAADRLTRFVGGALRAQSRRSMPAGSLPAALYADGTPAASHVLLEADAGAWWVSTVWRHAGFLDAASRLDYLRALWEPVTRATDFFGGWAAPGSDEPLPSFQPERLRDARSITLLLGLFMGFESALRIAREIDQNADPEWQVRQRELDSLLRFRIRDQRTPWPLDPLFPEWLRHIIGESHPVWAARVVCGGESGAMSEFGFPADVVTGAAAGPGFPDARWAVLQLIAAAGGGNGAQ
jgi:hypothetical protein